MHLEIGSESEIIDIYLLKVGDIKSLRSQSNDNDTFLMVEKEDKDTRFKCLIKSLTQIWIKDRLNTSTQTEAIQFFAYLLNQHLKSKIQW